MNPDTCDARDGSCTGHLVIVGGHDNRQQGMVILERFVALAGGRGASIFVLTAASTRELHRRKRAVHLGAGLGHAEAA